MFRDLLGFVDMIKQPELRELLHLITTGAGVADRLKAAPAFPVSSLDPLCFLNWMCRLSILLLSPESSAGSPFVFGVSAGKSYGIYKIVLTEEELGRLGLVV